MSSEPDSNSADTAANHQNAANSSRSFAPRPSLSRGFDAYSQQPTYPTSAPPAPTVPVSRKNPPPAPVLTTARPQKPRRLLSWLPWRSLQPPSLQPPPSQTPSSQLASQQSTSPPYSPSAYPLSEGVALPTTPSDALPGLSYELPTEEPVLAAPSVPRRWERQPYVFLAHLLLICGAITSAWVFGILVAQILPGRFSQPPFQESFLRKSSRVTNRLWHFPQLWQTPTEQARVDVVPLPETGPIVKPVVLSPIERQPLIDELNAVETEILTLDRRLQSLEKQLGRPLYQGTSLEDRINTMRTAIEAPVRDSVDARPYEPVARDPNDRLLEVAQLSITLPSDALFSPGELELRDEALLERVLDQLVDYPDAATISVRSHSDNQVGAIASRQYTLAQADAIARYLKASLPADHRWIAIGMGSAQPVTDNDNAAMQQQNRRIEILVDTR